VTNITDYENSPPRTFEPSFFFIHGYIDDYLFNIDKSADWAYYMACPDCKKKVYETNKDEYKCENC